MWLASTGNVILAKGFLRVLWLAQPGTFPGKRNQGTEMRAGERLPGHGANSARRRPVGRGARTRAALDTRRSPAWSGPRGAAASAEAIQFIRAPGWLPRGRRVYAIGDIHGCLTQLKQLHSEITRDLAARPIAAPLLLHLGDYIDNGPDSAGW